MTLLILSFLAGVLTIAAPCILPLLPVIVGGSLVDDKESRRTLRPLVIAASLAVSVVVFSLLLKATTSLLGVPQYVWQLISGTIIILLGASFLRPSLYERLPGMAWLNSASQRRLGASLHYAGFRRDVLIGASLGPVFNSCSPTYALVVASILPTSFATGLTYLTAYAIGLAGMLLVIAYAGQSVVRKLGWLSDPHGPFKRVIGVLFITVGLAVMIGLDKRAQTFILDQGWYEPLVRLEQALGL